MSIELFRRAGDYTTEVISGLGNEELRLATPCVDWNVGGVVLHLADVADGLVGLLNTGNLIMPDAPRIDVPDPVSILREAMDELTMTLQTTIDTERTDSATRAGAVEFTMHGWDIGVALNQDHRIPPDLAHDVRELVSSLLTDDARGSNFAPAVDVATDAQADERLAAFLGRRRPVADDAQRASGLDFVPLQ